MSAMAVVGEKYATWLVPTAAERGGVRATVAAHCDSAKPRVEEGVPSAAATATGTGVGGTSALVNKALSRTTVGRKRRRSI